MKSGRIRLFSVEVKILVEENGGVRKVIECSAVFFRRAAGAACSIDEPTDSIHFEQFILLRRSDVFKDFGKQFGADSFLDGLEHAKRVGDGRFFYSHLIADFNGSRWFSQCTVDGDSSVFTSVGGQCARFVDARCPKPLVNACFGIHRSMREWGLSIVEIHGAVDALQGVTFDRFAGAFEGFGHLLEIFSFKLSENEIHLSAFGEVIADAETQTCVFLRAEYLCDVFQPIVSGFAARRLESQLSKGKCEVINDNQGLLNGNFLLVHPIANSIARKIHVR